MAVRRMFSKCIVESDAFLDMPASAKLLYFYLGLNADDDGFVNGPKKVIREINATMDDLKVLAENAFVFIFNTGVVVLKHWRMQNSIQKDRYHITNNKKELNMLTVVSDKSYELKNYKDLLDGTIRVPEMDTLCIRDVSNLETEVSVDKVSVVESSIDKVSIGECSDDIAYQRGTEKITMDEYNKLTHTFSKNVVDATIRRILEKPYRNRLNYETVFEWCKEDNNTLAGERKSSKYEDIIGILESGGEGNG